MQTHSPGGSMKSKCTRSSIPSFFSCSTTDPKLDRRISGYVLSWGGGAQNNHTCVISVVILMIHVHSKGQECATGDTCLHLCFVGLLCVKAETFPWTCSAGSACPLLGRGFADGCDKQGLDSDTGIVHLHTCLRAVLNETAELDMDKKLYHTQNYTQWRELCLAHLLLGKSRVNDKHDTINCQRCLSNVCRNHNLRIK